MSDAPRDPIEGIAIVGMAARFPGAGDLDGFWQNLRGGVESITFFPADELVQAGVDPAVVRHPRFVAARGVIEGVELFDAAFFGYTPKEAQLMDPQHRLFLEHGWHALEDAGYCGEKYSGLVGVFAGLGLNQYLLRHLLPNPAAGTGLCYDKDFLATRLSYKLNLRGPSIVVQTACSTSLVAVCQACQSLLTYQADMVVAGGVSIQLPIRGGYFHEPGGVLSPDGHCRAFDRDARGTVMSSGIGVVVLKRLADAIEDGDTIRAVIRGFAANNDGSDKIGYMAPGIAGQAQAITMAQALAGVDPGTIGYVEAHGTGTELGDPIEIAALTQAFRASTEAKGFCAIGSVKTNIGHLDSAAGVAGLIKATLALQHGEIPPSLHFDAPNPRIDFENSPFFVNTQLTPWKTTAAPRRAGVSSFGIGGTNAHVVLEEAPPPPASGPSRPWQILPLSAQSDDALAEAAAALADHLEAHPDLSIADVSYTLQAGRKAFARRRAVACRTAAEAIRALREPQVAPDGGAAAPARRPLVFLFPGEPLPANAAADLYRAEEVFRRAIDRCAAIAGPDLARQPQAALFAIEYALAELWTAWGVEPDGAAGVGAGEFAAACAAGVFGVEDALTLVRARPGERAAVVAAIARAGRIGRPRTPFVSSATGAWIAEAEAADPEYWSGAAGSLGAAAGMAAVSSIEGATCLVLGAGGEPDGLQARTVACLSQEGDAGADGERLARALSALWAQGVEPDWAGYRRGERRRRVPLPGYPFQRKRFWIDPETPAHTRARQAVGASVDFADWFHVPSWRRSAVVAADDAPQPAGPVLVFADAATLGSSVAERLRAAGAAVTTVAAGSGYDGRDADRCTIDPASRADYVTLLEDLRARGRLPATIGHFWGVTADRDPLPADEVDARHQARGFSSLLNLAQAIGEVAPRAAMRIGVFTNAVHDVTGGEPVVPRKATVLGPCRVIPREFPTLTCRHVDLELDAAAAADAHVAAALAELARSVSEPVVAYRGGRRWIQGYERTRLDALAGAAPARLRSGGVYLVTGGTGGIGLVLARYLAEAVGARLVLTSRRGLPPRERWDELMAHPNGDGAARRIAFVRAIEAAGGEVMVAAADVTSDASMRAVIDRAIDRFGRIDGVVHAAGVAGGGMVQLKTPEAAAAVLAPKVEGARVLARVLADRPLDFLMLCSSLTSLSGDLGQVDYCAANAYLDAFAGAYAAATGTPAVAINWPAWREIGMAVDAARDRARGAANPALAGGLSNLEGVEAFSRILARARDPQVAVCGHDLQALVSDGRAPREEAAAERGDHAAAAAPLELHPRPALQTPFVAPRTEVERRICGIWQDSIGLVQVGIDDNFFELGGDSLLAVQLMSRMNEALGADIPVARLYEGLTIRFLAAQIESGPSPAEEEAGGDRDRLRDKARRQKDHHQQRRRALLGR